MFSAGLIWQNAAFGQDDDYGSPEQPEFHHSGYWADWIGKLSAKGHDQGLRDAGCGALFAHYVQEMADDEIEWVTPAELVAATDRFSELMQAGDKAIALAVLDYLNAEDYVGLDEARYPRPTREDQLRDLEMVKTMARWAQDLGKTNLAFEIG